VKDGNGLRDQLIAGYADFLRMLTRRLGSGELAQDALHETFLQVQNVSHTAAIRSPRTYLYRTALNIASNSRQREQRYLSTGEIGSFFDLADTAPGPSRIVEGRSDLAAVRRALAEMPARRRAILLAVWQEELATPAIAARHGIAIRTVQYELSRATEELRAALKIDQPT
jgi:RNA polymerase sigma-70 factor, ECF subfamily